MRQQELERRLRRLEERVAAFVKRLRGFQQRSDLARAEETRVSIAKQAGR